MTRRMCSFTSIKRHRNDVVSVQTAVAFESYTKENRYKKNAPNTASSPYTLNLQPSPTKKIYRNNDFCSGTYSFFPLICMRKNKNCGANNRYWKFERETGRV